MYVKRSHSRRGHTLLELVVAASLLAVTIVPALRLMRDALTQSRRIETMGLITTLAQGKLEERACISGASWTTGTTTGNYSADGYSLLKFKVVASDAAVDGGITNRLMAVTATVWEDTNGDNLQTSGELAATFATKIAKMALYQAKASGS